MKKQSLLGLIFINLITISVNSQVNFRPGFIISNNQDTIYGKIDYRSDMRMSEVCTFRTKEKEKIIYSPDEIFGFRFENGRFFISKEVDGKLRFFEMLIEGELSIFYCNYKTKPLYFFKKGITGDLIELKYFERSVTIDEYGMSSDGKNYRIDGYKPSKGYGRPGEYMFKSQEFKKVLLDSLKIEGELTDYVKKMKKPNHAGLIEFAKKYNEMTDRNKEIVIYHDLHKESDYVFSVCRLNINYREFWKDEIYTMYSFKGYTPLEYHKIYLGYGLQYASIGINNSNYKIFRIPLSVRYQYPGNLIKPHAALGLNIYAIKNGEKTKFIEDFIPSYTIGVAIKVYKNIHFTCNFEGDLLWSSYYNSSETATFSQTNNIGLMISL